MLVAKKFLKSTAVVSFLSLVSRILGFIRDMLLARFFGSSIAMEAFLVAFRLPDFMRRLLTEGTVTQALVPSFIQYQKSPKQLQYFLRQIITYVGVVTLLMSVLGIVASAVGISILAPGFYQDTTRFDLSSNLLKIMSPCIFFMSLTAILSSVLNSVKCFSVPAIVPIVLNITIIISIFASPYFSLPIYVVAYGITIGGLSQVLMLIPFIWKLHLSIMPLIRLPIKAIKKLCQSLIPAIIGASIVQISLVLDTVFASFLTVGSISWLYYSDRLTQFPLGVVGIGLSTVILPYLTQSRFEKKTFNRVLNWGLKLAFLISIPAALGMCMLAKPILIALFYYGEFNWIDIEHSRLALVAFSLGLVSFIIIKVLISGLYAHHGIQSVLRVGLLCLLLNIVANIILVMLLKAYLLAYVALAISTTVTAYLNALLLFYVLKQKYGFILEKQGCFYLLRIIAAVSLMCAVLYYYQGSSEDWINLTLSSRVVLLIKLIAIGSGSYFLSLYFMGFRKKDFSLEVHL